MLSEKERNLQLKAIKRENARRYRLYNRNKKKKVPEGEYLSALKDESNILEIEDLHTFFYTDIGTVRAVDGVTFSIPKGKTVGVVGESGCGKSVTSLSVMRLLQEPQGQIASGEIRFRTNDGRVINIAKAPVKEMEKIRGDMISMIFQEPMTTLNPVFTIGSQIQEVLKLHRKDLDRKGLMEKTFELIQLVGISNPERIYRMYPHELSGGMRQRIVIAMALACDPSLIIADEPTTALDVTIQAQILDLMRNLKDRIDASIMLITHDLGVVAEMADIVVVMYAGRIIEMGTTMDIFKNPLHPYTIGLMKSRPNMIGADEKLYSIPGNVPNPINLPDHCYFRNRCEKCIASCRGAYPELVSVSETHRVACHRYSPEVRK
ncbi:MAG: ABC transporter ATP-binding protein [Bullifex sp.]|nr:ABC transporter ATP-binding protein [Spirochaetales bacterium]MDY3850709.1 ABC transporter ATP-binding protein [Bullifex sp.]MDY5908314.1 ABC transporter ATP-binding protein [Bullifex sp.]